MDDLTTPILHLCRTSRRSGPHRCVVPILIVITLLAACDPAQEEDSPPPIGVRIEPAEPADFGDQFSLVGTLGAERASPLSPRIDGLVSRVHVDVGHRVAAGQVLVELDPSEARQSLERARAEQSRAGAAADEAGRLLAIARQVASEGVVAPSQVDAREADTALALAALQAARASVGEQSERLARHRLPAPFGGVIAQRLIEPGAWAQTGTPVLELVAIDRIRLDLRVPQERFAAFDAGATITVTSDALGGAGIPARVQARVPVTDPGDRTFLLRLVVDDVEGRLLPGTSARATISLPASSAAVQISRDALLTRPDGSHDVFVVEGTGQDLVARRRTVRIAHQRGDFAAVSEGVRVGERVVVRGNERLQDGQRVAEATRR